MNIEEQLKNETKKWKKRIESELKRVKAADKNGEHALENVKAYVRDSQYFLEKNDLTRAFEAIIWAWAVLIVKTEDKIIYKS